MDVRENIQRIIINNTPQMAIVELTEIIASDGNCWLAYLERGKLYWNEGKIKNAMNDYIMADRLNPDSIAGEILRHSIDIIQFRNIDILNP